MTVTSPAPAGSLAVGSPPGVGPLDRPPPGAPGAAVRLVCFAHAGGGPASYRRWAPALAPGIEVWTATLPGRARRAEVPFARSWPEVLDDVVDALADAASVQPVALLGHSLGGLVAYEAARALEARGGPRATHLFVSGCRPPTDHGGRWRPSPDDDRLVADVDRRYGAVPPAVRREPELLARFVPILRADLELAAAYRWAPGPALATPVTALSGADDRAGRPDDLHRWHRFTRGEFRERTFPGAHFFLHDELPDVADVIRRTLDLVPQA